MPVPLTDGCGAAPRTEQPKDRITLLGSNPGATVAHMQHHAVAAPLQASSTGAGAGRIAGRCSQHGQTLRQAGRDRPAAAAPPRRRPALPVSRSRPAATGFHALVGRQQGPSAASGWGGTPDDRHPGGPDRADRSPIASSDRPRRGWCGRPSSGRISRGHAGAGAPGARRGRRSG